MKKIGQMEPWLGKEEKDAVMAYMESGGWLTEHDRTREFEKAVAEYVGSKHACAVSNGTLSLAAALMALGLGKGDEVVVPDFTMIASANAVVLAGAEPKFVDVNRASLCVDAQVVEEAITEKTKAVMHVSLNGRCPEIAEIVKIAHEKGLAVIEDAAQSMGSRCGTKHAGTFGDVGSFSFSYAKVVTTGQGGVLVTDDEKLYQKLLLIKDYGRPKSGVDSYATMGYNFKFSDLLAVVGVEQMKKLEWRVQRKREMFRLYRYLLGGIPKLEFVETDLRETTPWFIDVLVTEKREQLAEYLKAEGIGTRPFYPAIHTQQPYAHVKGDFPNSVDISKRGLWLPSSAFLTDEDIELVCREIGKYFNTRN